MNGNARNSIVNATKHVFFSNFGVNGMNINFENTAVIDNTNLPVKIDLETNGNTDIIMTFPSFTTLDYDPVIQIFSDNSSSLAFKNQIGKIIIFNSKYPKKSILFLFRSDHFHHCFSNYCNLFIINL